MIIHTNGMQVHTVVRTRGLHYRNICHEIRGNFRIIDHKTWISEKQDVEEADILCNKPNISICINIFFIILLIASFVFLYR